MGQCWRLRQHGARAALHGAIEGGGRPGGHAGASAGQAAAPPVGGRAARSSVPRCPVLLRGFAQACRPHAAACLPHLLLLQSVQTFGRKKNAVAVAYVKRGKGEIRLNGERRAQLLLGGQQEWRQWEQLRAAWTRL